MTRRVLIALTCAATLWLAGARPVAAGPVEDRIERARELSADIAEHRAAKAKLLSAHADQTAEVAALKRRKSSWRRDRALRKALAEAQATAKRLAKLDARIRALRGRLKKAQRSLLTAIDAELKSGPSSARKAQLSAMRRRVARALKPPARKIVLPSERIDPLADTDELSEQSSLLAETARKLEREENALAQREQRYTKMARLQRASARADEAEVFDDNRPRRTTSQQAGPASAGGGRDNGDFGGASAPEADADDASGVTGESEPPGDFSDPTIVLVDVVDAGTIDALRAAERSDDPSVKAKAAKRARQQVRARRERLERQRKKIQARIRALRDAR